MKNLLIIPLMLVYLTMSVGLTILIHTCGGESEAMVATTSTEDPCGCGDMMPEDRCCTTELSTVKLSDEQKSASAPSEQQWMFLGMLAAVHSPLPAHTETSVPFSTATDPPPPPDDLCIVHSVFRI
jgi:hypothetical protein